MTLLTTVKVPVSLRDRVRRNARNHGMTLGDYLDKAVSELEQAEFIRAVQAQKPDDAYVAETMVLDALSAPITEPWVGPIPGSIKKRFALETWY